MKSALFHLEMKQILHRDVKPGNVAQCEDGSISNWKLVDFDSACYLDSPQQAGVHWRYHGVLCPISAPRTIRHAQNCFHTGHELGGGFSQSYAAD
mmetsp:Transcript_24069/g.49414  ORF Transcript_24069/g.49414 Transcript_24069/m.49414 type:complete len:95 (+) Transcript_24069:679-963(+)